MKSNLFLLKETIVTDTKLLLCNKLSYNRSTFVDQHLMLKEGSCLSPSARLRARYFKLSLITKRALASVSYSSANLGEQIPLSLNFLKKKYITLCI